MDEDTIGRDALPEQRACASQIGEVNTIGANPFDESHQKSVSVETRFSKIRKVPVGSGMLLPPRAGAVQYEQSQAGQTGHPRHNRL